MKIEEKELQEGKKNYSAEIVQSKRGTWNLEESITTSILQQYFKRKNPKNI